MQLVRRPDCGSLVVEAAVLVPVLMLFALVAVGAGRYDSAKLELEGAARAAVEAVVAAPDPGDAESVATAAAMSNLGSGSSPCHNPAVQTDTRRMTPGGVVSVTLVCTVFFGDLLIPGLGRSATIQVTRAAPLDPFRYVG